MRIALVATFLILAAGATDRLAAQGSAGSWRQISLETSPDGFATSPSCSGGPVSATTPAGQAWVPADTRYSFFIRDGDSRRLFIIWDGGGACWDYDTCIGSVLAGSPVYDLTVNETPESLAALGGMADRNDPRNPVRDFTQVFIPYCTGDLHQGWRDTGYALASGGDWTIHHRGAINVAAVLSWLRDYYDGIGQEPDELVLAGVSAGGYGVLHNYPALANTFPTVRKVRLLVDSANGIITDALYEQALAPGGSWGIWEDLDRVLQGAYASGPDTLLIQTFRDLSWEYPWTRFGQYTRAVDSTQILFYNIARHIGEPLSWLDPLALLVSARDWTDKARETMEETARKAWNYRYYLASGAAHTILGEPSYYDEHSGGGTLFSDWVADMIDNPWISWTQWTNATCEPSCLEFGQGL